MQKVQSEMARLKVVRARAGLEHTRAALNDKEYYEAIARKLKAAVEAGELTEKEAKQKWAELKTAREKDAAGATNASSEKAVARDKE